MWVSMSNSPWDFDKLFWNTHSFDHWFLQEKTSSDPTEFQNNGTWPCEKKPSPCSLGESSLKPLLKDLQKMPADFPFACCKADSTQVRGRLWVPWNITCCFDDGRNLGVSKEVSILKLDIIHEASSNFGGFHLVGFPPPFFGWPPAFFWADFMREVHRFSFRPRVFCDFGAQLMKSTCFLDQNVD